MTTHGWSFRESVVKTDLNRSRVTCFVIEFLAEDNCTFRPSPYENQFERHRRKEEERRRTLSTDRTRVQNVTIKERPQRYRVFWYIDRRRDVAHLLVCLHPIKISRSKTINYELTITAKFRAYLLLICVILPQAMLIIIS